MKVNLPYLIITFIFLISSSQFRLEAQDYIEINPLFEYPMAPESLSSLTEKTNYLVEHFWDPMDFKSKSTVDQNALNHAMKVYTVSLRWADKTKCETAINKLIEKLSKNPTLLAQFTKAAEEHLYGPRADFWIDAVYLKFVEAYVKNKKIPEARKPKYRKQLTTLGNTQIGEKAPEFNFTGKNGKSERYMPMSTPTVIIIGDPTLPDWRLARLRMETNVRLNQAIDQGKLNMLYIIPYDFPSWEKEVSNYSDKWMVGIAPELSDILDIRANPSIYYIDKSGKLMLKNASLDEVLSTALNNLEQANS